MNSFRFLERGIEAELERQRGLLEAGEEVDAGHAPLPPRGRLADPAALEGVRARLPLLPRARPGPGGADRGDDRRRRASRCPSCPPRGASATCPRSGSPRRPRRPSPSRPSTASTSSGRSRPPTGPRRRRSPTGSPASWSRRLRQAGGEEDPLASKATPESVAALAGLVEAKTISHGVRQAGAGEAGRRGRRPGRRSSRARASPRSPTRASWRRSSIAAIEAEPEAAEQVKRRATRRRSAASSAP